MDLCAGLVMVKEEVERPGPLQSTCVISVTTGQALSLFSCQPSPFRAETLESLLDHAEVHTVSPLEAASDNLQEWSATSLHQNPHPTSESSGTGNVGVAATTSNCGMNFDVVSTTARRAQYIEKAPSTSRKKYFACHLCPYSSSHKDTVVRHIRTHTKERPFKCSLCSSSFLRKHHLTKHIASAHADQKP